MFTAGKVTTLPIGVTTTLGLAEIRAALMTSGPDHATLTGGWASNDDTGSNLRQFNAAPPASDPILVPATQTEPEHLLARYYFWVRDARAVADSGNATEQELHRLDAIDVLVVESAPGTFIAVFSSRNVKELNLGSSHHGLDTTKPIGALTSFESKIKAADGRATVQHDRSPLAHQNAEFFLWLMERWRDQQQLEPRIRLVAVNGLNGQDQSRRTTQLQQDVDFYRVGLLTAIAESDTLGPVKVAFKDEIAGVKLDVELFVDGGFAFHLGRSFYPNIIEKPLIRLTAVKDLVFTYIPVLRDLYANDTDWVNTRRAAFIHDAFIRLADRYKTDAGSAVCPHCGGDLQAA